MESSTDNFLLLTFNEQQPSLRQQPSSSSGLNLVHLLQSTSAPVSTGICNFYHHRQWAPDPTIWDSDNDSGDEAHAHQEQQHSGQNRQRPSMTDLRAGISVSQRSMATAGPDPRAWDTDASDEEVVDGQLEQFDQQSRQRLSMPTLNAQQQSQQQQIVQQPSRATGPSSPSGQHQQNDTVRQCQDLPGRRVFVGGLTDETTMADLLTHFEQFGQIHEIVITKVRENNPQAVLKFFTARQARDALQGRHFFTLPGGGQRQWFVRLLED